MQRFIALLLIILPLASPSLAAPARYSLSADASTVSFETDFGANKITGQMPISRADLTIDFAKLSNSKVNVTLDVGRARASFPFATDAMKGPKVLDARAHPQLTFTSTAIKPEGEGARVTGRVTLRGVTKPMVLRAEIWRKKGSAEGDLSNLTVRLTGSLKRSDFGATGWGDMVGDEVRIVIIARIAQAG
ncbi:MAG: YceI family protein [Paracoccaceae bacterium]